MTLAEGTKFGPYRIFGLIAAGGMGEVYRAIDTELDREVAIKVLPASFADDADRVQRFRREAKTLAALNHANIAQIYGLESTGEQTVIVMELVEGKTLAERLEAGPLAPNEAMAIAMQIVDALEAAHARGIVHRDLKPANITLQSNGTVKVLDFGIAKALSVPEGDGDPLATGSTGPNTSTGIVLGTTAYMSPEQARGKPVDQRADIWAFACVLFEMLTGQPAFVGEDAAVTLARVLASDTDLNSLPAAVSPAVRQTLQICLRKEPSQRIADIRDVRLALAGEFETIVANGVATQPQRVWARRSAIAASFLLAAAVAGIAGWALKNDPPMPLIQTLITPGTSTRYAPYDGDSLELTPDGSRVIYVGESDGQPVIFVRELAQLEARPVRVPSPIIRNLFVSADGGQIGYSDGSALYRVSVAGGPPQLITDTLDGFPRGAAWGPDDTIVFASNGPQGLMRVPAAGGVPEEITTPTRPGTDHQQPAWLPDGSGVIFEIRDETDPDSTQIALVSFPGLEVDVLFSGGATPRYAASGHIVFARNGALHAVGFDRASRTTSTSVAVVDQVATDAQEQAQYALATNGTLLYGRGSAASEGSTIVAIDRDGRRQPLGAAPAGYGFPRLAPDGTRLAVDIDSQDVWVYDLVRNVRTRVTDAPGMDNRPVWHPDGESLVFASMREQLGQFNFFRQRADGTGVAEKLLTGPGPGMFKGYGWTPDGTQLIFDYGQQPSLDIGVMTMGEPADWRPLLASAVNESAPSLSPDGNWIAYTSDRTGRCEVFVERFPELGNRVQVSANGGAEPLWSRDGGELFYRQDNALMSAPMDMSAGLNVGRAEVVFDGLNLSSSCLERRYEASADGQRFFFVLDPSNSGEQRDFVLVQNWFHELERLVPTGR